VSALSSIKKLEKMRCSCTFAASIVNQMTYYEQIEKVIKWHEHNCISQPSLKDLSEIAGLSRSSKLHNLSILIESVTPAEFKSTKNKIEITYGTHKTPFGKCLVGIAKRSICHFVFIESNEKVAISEMKLTTNDHCNC